MLIYDILNRNKKKLKFLNGGEQNISVVLNAINEFKKHNITNLDEVIENTTTQNNEYLKIKLEDLNMLYKSLWKKVLRTNT